MFELAETLYDAGYDYMLDPDHAPSHPEDPDRSPITETGPYAGGSGRVTQGFAFQFGFVVATIAAVKRSRGLEWGQIKTVGDSATPEKAAL